MPPLARPSNPVRSGLRLVDDLFARRDEEIVPAPGRPTTIRAATPYETYLQPAVLGLRRALEFVAGRPEDQVFGLVHPLGMAGAPAAKGAHWLGDLARDALRGARKSAPQSIDVLEPAGVRAVNASGESAASLEALGRRAWEQATGRQRVRIDRAGRETPFLGELGDDRVNPGELVGYRSPDVMGRASRAASRQFVTLDRTGRETPWLGFGQSGDELRPNPGERIGWRYADGRFEELAKGR